MSDSDEESSIVVDCGSGYIRAGWGGEDAPRVIFPTVVGKPKSGGKGSCVIGDTSQSLRTRLNFQSPIEHGIVTNWDDMEEILRHTFFNELRLREESPLEHPVLMADAPMSPMGDREKMTQLMFEKFQVPGFYMSNEAILSVYASGRGSAMCVSCGHGVTHVLSVYEGYCNRASVARLDLGGHDLTSYLGLLLGDRGYGFYSSGEHQMLREMKEKTCYVASDFSHELTTPCKEQEYELPDGQVITLADERFRVPEALFQPSLLGSSSPGLHDLVHGCLMTQDIDTRPDLSVSVVLSGGSTMFPGFADRLTKELKDRISPTMKVKVVAPPERKFLVWIGGSILASLSTFQQCWITRQEYQEWGPNIVHLKCPI